MCMRPSPLQKKPSSDAICSSLFHPNFPSSLPPTPQKTYKNMTRKQPQAASPPAAAPPPPPAPPRATARAPSNSALHAPVSRRASRRDHVKLALPPVTSSSNGRLGASSRLSKKPRRSPRMELGQTEWLLHEQASPFLLLLTTGFHA